MSYNIRGVRAAYYLGLDLGQLQDPTAIAIVERHETAFHEIDSATRDWRRELVFNLLHLERVKLGTPYTEIATYVHGILNREAVAGNITLVVDATGVGRPVVDLLKEKGCAPMVPVTITAGGRQSSKRGEFYVPKHDLVSAVSLELERGRLKIANGLKDTPILLKELMNFKRKITQPGNETYGAWRDGEHDDLVLACSLALWRARNFGPSRQQQGPLLCNY